MEHEHAHQRAYRQGEGGEEMNTTKNIQLDKAAQIFRAMTGDKAAQAEVTLADVEGLHHAESFEDFLRVNQLQVFEEVVR